MELTYQLQKSAIIEMFSLKTNYNFLSDEKTTWTKNKGTIITLTLYPNSKETKVILPVTPVYKYLGVKTYPEMHISKRSKPKLDTPHTPLQPQD